MPFPFNPLDALNRPHLFNLFLRMLSHRYRTDILIDYYHLNGVHTKLCWWGDRIEPSEKARKELEFLRDHNGDLDHIERVVHEFRHRLGPRDGHDHLVDHLKYEEKYNEIALRASDLKLIKALFSLFPDHQSVRILDIGCGRNQLAGAIRSYFDAWRDLAKYFNWPRVPELVRIGGVDVKPPENVDNDPTVEFLRQPSPTVLPPEIEPESVNVVITKWSFHHMSREEMDCQVENIFRILQPGGLVIVIEAFATRAESSPYIEQLMRISEQIDFADIWPDGPWKKECFEISRDYLHLPFEDQTRILALEDFVGHYVLNKRGDMPYPFSYLSADELVSKFASRGFKEQRHNFLLFGFAPVIRRGPPTARFMFEKPRP